MQSETSIIDRKEQLLEELRKEEKNYEFHRNILDGMKGLFVSSFLEIKIDSCNKMIDSSERIQDLKKELCKNLIFVYKCLKLNHSLELFNFYIMSNFNNRIRITKEFRKIVIKFNRINICFYSLNTKFFIY